jgi:hypothetical protein
VSDKDIRAHEGLVRCGNCYSVFNSSWNLTDDPRNEAVGNPLRDSGDGQKAYPGSGFTFSIIENDTDESDVGGNVSDYSENLSGPAGKESKSTDENSDQPADDFLEPFPEPEMGDVLKPVPLAAEQDKKNNDSLLYFDSDQEEDNKAASIEDTSIIKMPSFSDDGELLDLDESLMEADVSESESTLMSMTEESMWPGSEPSFEDIGSGFDLPVLNDDQSEAESSVYDAEETLPVLPDIFINEPAEENDLVEGLNDPFHFNQPIDIPEDFLPESEELDDGEVAGGGFVDDIAGPVVPVLPPLDGENEVAKFEQGDIADGTVITEGKDTDDDSVSVESLSGSVDKEFSLDEEESDDDSVFITSQEEELDNAYIPITVKHDVRDELFHDLDDFPEPGELSKLNYDDTMEINAMLEAANISKEQIDSALLSSEADDNDKNVEEILLSSDAGVDLTDAIFISNEEDNAQSGIDTDPKKKAKLRGSFLKNMLPLGWGEKQPLTEPSVMGSDETQLIQNLNRGKNKTELPAWIARYSLIAANVLLALALMVQIGYFYMDKLVHITPIHPLLEVGCKVAGCTVPSIQNTADIEQLSSRLSPLAGGDGGFKVDSILVNRGIRSQGLPALELTLTDRAGNMISRRVVTPDQYLPAGQPLEMKPNGAVDVSIRFRTPSIRVDGFELRPVSQNWLERN